MYVCVFLFLFVFGGWVIVQLFQFGGRLLFYGLIFFGEGYDELCVPRGSWVLGDIFF